MILSITRLIEMGIDGFSTTVFCYGQTGSGKTHTLTGPPYLVSLSSHMNQITMRMVILFDFLLYHGNRFDDHDGG